MRKHHSSHRSRAAPAGFTIIELAIVIAVLGLLLVPLLQLTAASIGATREQETAAALAAARDALIAFAAANGGCLPFATDYEGGYPDTDATGASGGYVDTGTRSNSNHAGDLPWADLGLTNSHLDGDGLRIQYYVATPFTDNNSNAGDGINCLAGYRGFEWNQIVNYAGTSANPVYVYYTSGAPPTRKLYTITGAYPTGTPPPDAVGLEILEGGDQLPSPLLEFRRGPDVTSGTNGQDDVLSTQNVFVLIAPGDNTNSILGRQYVRDSNHVLDSTGADWLLQNITNTVDDVIFSGTPNVDTTDEGNDGDDTLLVMSFVNFKAEMNRYGLNMEAVCDGTC